MEMISIDYHGNVALARLNRSVTNALNPEFVQELSKVVRRVSSDTEAHGFVLGSSNEKFFSIGFDITELFELKKNDFREFYRMFNKVCMDLYTLPKPTVAAISGHAIAGGCILALCCDYRFIAEGRKLMGLNEVKLGAPVPYLADRLLHALTGVRQAREMMESGEFYAPEETLAMGVVDKILPMGELVETAVAHAGKLGALPGSGYKMIKRNRVEVIEAAALAREADKEQYFMECWYSEETRERLREAMKKF